MKFYEKPSFSYVFSFLFVFFSRFSYRFSYVFPMIFPFPYRFSYRFSMVFPFSYWIPMDFPIFPQVFLWFSNFPLGFSCVPMVFIQASWCPRCLDQRHGVRPSMGVLPGSAVHEHVGHVGHGGGYPEQSAWGGWWCGVSWWWLMSWWWVDDELMSWWS